MAERSAREPKSISVIGGLGRMGALMTRLFTEAGYQVQTGDPKAGPIPWEELAQAEVVLLAVPIPVVDEVLQRIGPHTRQDGVVIDICSLKEAPINSMLKHCRGEVIGSHPLFGPNVDSLAGQTVFVCPARTRDWFGWFSAFIQGLGANLVEIGPEEHDWLMARVQVLRYMTLLSFGLSLSQLDFDFDKQLPLSGPWFSQLVSMLERQMELDPGLFADMAIHNPAADQVFDSLAKAAQEVADAFASTDRQTITDLVARVSSSLRA